MCADTGAHWAVSLSHTRSHPITTRGTHLVSLCAQRVEISPSRHLNDSRDLPEEVHGKLAVPTCD
jgi:hypothetical protein